MSSSSSSDAPLDKRGYLLKLGRLKTKWNKRFFVLKGTDFYYLKDESKAAAASPDESGQIRFFADTKILAAPAKSKSGKCAFEIHSDCARSIFLAAASDKERDEWIAALSAAVERRRTKKVGIDDFKLLKVIGQGSFGKVLMVVKKDSNGIYAMKVLNKSTIVARNDEDHIRAERRILEQLQHPFLVNLHYSFQTPDKLYFVMDFVNGGELFYHMQQVDNFDEARTRFYVAEISAGLFYLHENGVLYRDLKPENVLVSRKGHICLTDFGISKEGLDTDESTTGTFVGTPEYLAPEILQGQKYGKAVDWWSLGTLMYEMLTGLPPFYSEDVQVMYAKILKDPIKWPKNVSKDARDLLEHFLERDPKKRYKSPDQIKPHKFFKGLNWNDLVDLKITPPYKPPIKDDKSTSMVDPEFTKQKAELEAGEAVKNFEGFTFVGV